MNVKWLPITGLVLGLLVPLPSWPQEFRGGGNPGGEGANDFVPLRQPRFVLASNAEESSFLASGRWPIKRLHLI